MRSFSSRGGLLLLTLLQQFPATVFLYGEPFFARERFHWSTGQIGLSQALVGFSIAISSYIGGKIAHRRHSRTGVMWGILLAMAFSVLGWGFGDKQGVFVLTFVGFAFCQALVWPGIETALVQGQTAGQVGHTLSHYNVIWSFGSWASLLLATPLMARLGLRLLLLLPALLYLVNYVLLRWLFPIQPLPCVPTEASLSEQAEAAQLEQEQKTHSLAEKRAYRWLGWIANPFGFVALNVVISSNPALQVRLGIPFEVASVWCSLWLLFRILSFEILRHWTGWHYRWGILVTTFFLMMVSFTAITLAPNLPIFLVAQAVFGLCLGLLYQSSIFYSLADSEAAGEHGGLHECVIGLGTMSGNLLLYVSSVGLVRSPQFPIYCVLGLMAVGWCVLFGIGMRVRKNRIVGLLK